MVFFFAQHIAPPFLPFRFSLCLFSCFLFLHPPPPSRSPNLPNGPDRIHPTAGRSVYYHVDVVVVPFHLAEIFVVCSVFCVPTPTMLFTCKYWSQEFSNVSRYWSSSILLMINMPMVFFFFVVEERERALATHLNAISIRRRQRKRRWLYLKSTINTGLFFFSFLYLLCHSKVYSKALRNKRRRFRFDLIGFFTTQKCWWLTHEYCIDDDDQFVCMRLAIGISVVNFSSRRNEVRRRSGSEKCNQFEYDIISFAFGWAMIDDSSHTRIEENLFFLLLLPFVRSSSLYVLQLMMMEYACIQSIRRQPAIHSSC